MSKEDVISQLRLEPHPARIDVHGVLVEAFPEMRQVMLGTSRLGYCGAPGKAGYALTFIERLPQEVQDAVVEFCTAQGCRLLRVSSPPSVQQMQALEAQLNDNDDAIDYTEETL